VRGFNVTCYRGAPPPRLSQHLEIVVGTELPVAFTGLRALMRGLQEVTPALVQEIASKYPSEWNELFPGTFAGAELLERVALSPSERRLHRESEQVFRVLHAGARVIVSVLDTIELPLVLRLAGKCDLVSLRALMYAVEWSRIKPVKGEILLAEWLRQPGGELIGNRMQRYAECIRERMEAGLYEDNNEHEYVAACVSLEPGVAESLYFHLMMDENQTCAVRIAAAACAIRSCFFSTNYEGALLACEQGLAQLEIAGGALDSAAVRKAFRELEPENATAAIEIDEMSLSSRAHMQTLFLRSAAVVYALIGDTVAASEILARALYVAPTHTSSARLHMLRALLFAKRTSHMQEALQELQLGLEALQGHEDAEARLEEGWLRNVLALVYVQQRLFDRAFAEERSALKCLTGISTPSATHLKINLISNLSVLQEMLKRYDAALDVWGHFARISDRWDTNFAKHYHYRKATLQLKANNREAALENYRQAYQYAVQLSDYFHQQAIASDLGVLYLESGCITEAATWFARASEAAKELGDPFRLSESLLGCALASGSSDLETALVYAQASTTYREMAQQLCAVVMTGEREAILSQLPHPRSKLNRPFDLVNINLFVSPAVVDKEGLVKEKSLV
jgi:tetratricopeptide (TPR) repeat protein